MVSRLVSHISLSAVSRVCFSSETLAYCMTIMNMYSHCIRSGPTFDLIHKNLAWWVVACRTSQNHKTVKIGGGCLCGGGRLPGTIQYYVADDFC